VDVNKDNSIARFKEEVARLQACLAEQEKQHLQLLAKVSPPVRPSAFSWSPFKQKGLCRLLFYVVSYIIFDY
jgi:hypothetical protein